MFCVCMTKQDVCIFRTLFNILGRSSRPKRHTVYLLHQAHSGDVALGSGYGPVSGKVASEFFFSAGNARMDMVSRPTDISVDGFESSPVSLLRCFVVKQIDKTAFISILVFHS